MQVKSTLWGIKWLAMCAVAAWIAGGCSSDNGNDGGNVLPEVNHAPVCDSIVASSNPAPTGTQIEIRAWAHDADQDCLIYVWSTFPPGTGYFPSDSRNPRIEWIAPQSTGPVYIVTEIADGEATIRDSLYLNVVAGPDCWIEEPNWGNHYSVGDSVRFIGHVSDEDNAPGELTVRWISNYDGLLMEGSADATGRTEFVTTALSYQQHQVILEVEDRDGMTDSAMVNVNVLEPPAPAMYPPTSEGMLIQLAWTPVSVPDFSRYVIYSGVCNGWLSPLGERQNVNDTTFMDTSVWIGGQTCYFVEVETSHEFSARSDTVDVTTGHLVEFNADLGRAFFAGQPDIVYVALLGSDSVVAVNAQSGEIVARAAAGDGPQGMCWIAGRQQLFAVNRNEHSVSVLGLPDLTPLAEWNLPEAGWDIAYSGPADRLLVTTGLSNGPVYVLNPDDGSVVAQIQGPTFPDFAANSILATDPSEPYVYIGEVGGSPSSLYKYTIANDDPQFLLEDEHGSLGSNMQDMAIAPDGQVIYVACGAPYYIQLLSPQTFQQEGQLDTGPYPNAIAASANGNRVFAGHQMQDILGFDAHTRAQICSFQFAHTVSDRGVAVSGDGRYVAVVLEGGLFTPRTLALIDLQEWNP